MVILCDAGLSFVQMFTDFYYSFLSEALNPNFGG